MQTETVIIMVVGLVAISLIRLVIAVVGREFAADHPHVRSTRTASTKQIRPGRIESGRIGSGQVAGGQTADAAITELAEIEEPATDSAPRGSRRPVRGTGRQSHLLYFPNSRSPHETADQTTNHARGAIDGPDGTVTPRAS
ncbi:MAG: hypothetical protein ACRCYU_11670 [Nocardioides sp.]